MYSKQEYLFLVDLKKAGIYDLLIANHAIIAGGAVRAIFANEYISDYDVFFGKAIDEETFIAGIEKLDYELSYKSDSAKTYTKDGVKVQVISTSLISGSAQQVIDQFDYTICMGAYDFEGMTFVLHENFVEHIARKELYYNTAGKYPISSLFRLRKYIKKGYTIPGLEIIKLALSINNLKMTSFRDLRGQLMGIDILFLKTLTDKLMEDGEKEYSFDAFMTEIEVFSSHILDNLFDE
jgi:hypothetical protein